MTGSFAIIYLTFVVIFPIPRMKRKHALPAQLFCPAATFVAVGSEAEGQVIYTDIDPDVTIDLNGDFLNLT